MEDAPEPTPDFAAGMLIGFRFVGCLPGHDEVYTQLRDTAVSRGEPVRLISASGHECALLPFRGEWRGSAR